MASSSTFPQDCGSYTLLDFIGKGTYGWVYKAHSKVSRPLSSQKEVALKKIKYAGANEMEKQYALREVDVMKQCDHLNIISYRESFFEEGNSYFCIVMEYCQNGNMQNYIKQNSNNISEKDFIHLLIHITRGVEYLHSKDIIHRDLKLTNLLLTLDNTVKIADFGVARVLNLTMFNALSYVGTHRYMSPEMHHGKDYDEKTDIWSVGCTAYEMATGKSAYTTKSIVDLKTQLGRGQLPDFDKIMYCEDMKNLIKSMLQLSSPKRPKASTLVNVLSNHSTCHRETASTQGSTRKDYLTGGDSGYEAEWSGNRSDNEGGGSDIIYNRKRTSYGDNLRTRSNPVRGRYPSESDKFVLDTSAGIQAELVKKLHGAEPVAEILRILRTEKDKTRRKVAIKNLVGRETYKEIRNLIKALKPLEDELSSSSYTDTTNRTVTSTSSSSADESSLR